MRAEDRPQTIKQAKQAFKTRGSTSVSAQERRRLERGAQLLERANRIKEQEQRKKELLRKKGETKDPPRQKQVLLGTQRKLDKFGYKSSQFHLGAFLKTNPSLPPGTTSVEPWDDEALDDDTLLELTDDEENHQPSLSGSNLTALAESNTTSPHHNEHQWEGFLASSSQLARELSDEKPTPKKPTVLSSFGSIDFSSEDIEALDPSYESPALMGPPPRPSPQTTSRAVSTLKNTHRHDESSRLMPPPQFPARGKPTSDFRPMDADMISTDHFGISMADLERLAGEDVELTQCPGD